MEGRSRFDDETVVAGASVPDEWLPDRRDPSSREAALLELCRRVVDSAADVAPAHGMSTGASDLWRDCGWEVEVRIEQWRSVVAVAPVALPGRRPYLAILCESAVGTIGRLIGRSDRRCVVQTAAMVSEVLRVLSFPEVRWYRHWGGSWDDEHDQSPPAR